MRLECVGKHKFCRYMMMNRDTHRVGVLVDKLKILFFFLGAQSINAGESGSWHRTNDLMSMFH